MADLHFMQSRACLVNLVASKQASNSFYQPTVLINRGHTASAIVQTLNVEVTLCVVGVDAGNAVTPSTGPPTSDGVLYILHMGDGTIPTVRKN